jgi:hypothetical protein
MPDYPLLDNPAGQAIPFSIFSKAFQQCSDTKKQKQSSILPIQSSFPDCFALCMRALSRMTKVVRFISKENFSKNSITNCVFLFCSVTYQ